MSQDYVATTRGVRITVRSFYLDDRSDPSEGRWLWAYKVRIENRGQLAVQLLRRTWRITDARGHVQEVHGPGVVGEQPLLDPGEEFEYTSGTPLSTPSGIMAGLYHMVVPATGEMVVPATGEQFDAVVPTFSLDSPHQDTRLH